VEHVKPFIELPEDKVLTRLGTAPEGLTSKEAAKRLVEYGPNELPHRTTHLSSTRFFAYLKDGFSILLLIASVLSFISGTPVVGFVILGIVIVNAYASVLQEMRAEKTVEALKSWMPESAKVIRDGNSQKTNVRDLVPGDLILLDQGDRVPADARLVEAYDVWVNNIPLTGEAEPQPRNASATRSQNGSYLEAPNLVFMSTSVVRGHGKAVVIATGTKTKFGEIASLTLEIKEPQSPLEKEIAVAAKKDFALAMSVGVVFFSIALGWLQLPLYQCILFMIGVMVCLVPEGLQLTVSSALGISTVQMARQNVLVKRLSAVQTLGSVTAICTDKTGTITKGEMTVRKLFAGDSIFDVSGLGYNLDGGFSYEGKVVKPCEYPVLDKLVETAVLCNLAKVQPPSTSHPKSCTIIGDALDGALLVAALKYGLDIQLIRDKRPIVRIMPFDTARKRAMTVHRFEKKFLVCVKGAPFDVFPSCTKVIASDGKFEEITPEYLSHLEEVYKNLARDGLRMIACAYKELHNDVFSEGQNVEHDLILLGLIAMHDPPRNDVKEAVRVAKEAGIDVIIITGDSAYTTQAIASEVGIIESGDERLIRGKDLDKLSDGAIAQRVQKGDRIFARVSPEEKFRIVKSLKDAGEIVAVTGDGANDAPSLKEANIGVAMGASGTDIARENADIVLLDDSFASIVKAVESGRTIYDNIRRFIVYVFSHNWAELVPYLLFLFVGIPLPLLVMQILAIDLFIDVIPSLAISREPAEPGIMKQPPRSTKEHLFDIKVLLRSLYVGLIISAGAMILCLWTWSSGGWQLGVMLDSSNPVYIKGTTMTFAGIVLGQVANVFSCRTNRVSAFRVGFSRNKWIILGIAAQVGILAIIVYLPWLQPVFGTAALSVLDWGYLFLVTLGVIAAEEARKFIARAQEK
jgi:magnesium-transporting ATPase (P-type)